ncbi:hypothetical protein [Hymenobacter persicinus]|uniref:Uncharacterized protein n=1 Tax=Hymenobacter persicinus TaxID=2025506 RepID=A0A4Q5LEP7_9BACT|nr:hypothetical protein [Hymenobacter persicinus]RYU81227.1 hypothetical protein EWM57_06530 [Hymenobacter persicinus]
MFVSQPQRFTYRSRLSVPALRAVADEFVARQGGPQQPGAYVASWLSATVLEATPREVPRALRYAGKQRATLELPLAAGDARVNLTIYPASLLSTLFYGILVGGAYAGFSCLQEGHWLHVGLSVSFVALATGSLRIIQQASTKLLRQDLEQHFQLNALG